MGNKVSINEQLASHKLSAKEISLWFSLPSNMKIVEGSFNPKNPDIVTTGESRVSLSLTQAELRISIYPALVIDPFMISKHALSGLTYTFLSKAEIRTTTLPSGQTVTLPVGLSGKITDVKLEYLDYFPSFFTDDIKSAVSDTFMNMIRGTRYTRPNYLPLNDPDPGGGLEEIKANLTATPNTGKVNLALAHVKRVGGEIRVVTKEAILEKTGSQGIEVPAGANLSIEIELLGNAEEISNKYLGLSSAVLTGDNIYVVDGDERVVKLKKLRLLYGGTVQVLDFELVSKAAAAAQLAEALGRLLVAAETKSAEPLEGRMVISSLAEKQLNEALNKVGKRVYRENFDVLQKAVFPFSLQVFFGMSPDGQPLKGQ